MAVTMAEISKLRTMTGAGMMDCKNALTEAAGEFEKAIEIIRKKGQAVAAKRSDREASEGCVLAKTDAGFAAIIALKCETDFVAKNADFVALTQSVLDAAIAAKCKTIDEVKALVIDGRTIAELVIDRSGVTGEKMELDFYEFVAGSSSAAYIHPGNKLATIVAFAEDNAEYETIRGLAMHIAAMSPVAIDESAVPQKVKDNELAVAIDKTKIELIAKEVEVALKKAGINPAHVDSENHIESNMAKGWITAEDAAKAREIKTAVVAEKTATLSEQKVTNIAAGRMAKFFKEYTLVEQKYEGGGEEAGKITVKELLAKKHLTCVAFKRVTLNQE
ncbi:MAG: translation elongation factor Ts [Porphyromonadaceae bacterium CG2_30_38_12]|nr:MAG: translation elongation factor Ts [Porphyromonadaceae bacterium CG2_30_38_12]